MAKRTDIKTAVQKVRTGDTLLLGGFDFAGCPLNLIYELAKHPDIKELTTVAEGFGIGGLPFVQGQEALLRNGQLKKAIVSFIGSHKTVEQAVLNGEMELEFVPMGTLAERLHAGGAGLGGFYTPTGAGTELEEKKEVRIINGRKYLFEEPLRGNVAFIKAYMADTTGNAVFRLTASNFNICMAMAADTVVLEVENIVEAGEIAPDKVQLPGIFVDFIVQAEGAVF